MNAFATKWFFHKSIGRHQENGPNSVNAQAWDGLTVVYGFDNFAFIYGMKLKY